MKYNAYFKSITDEPLFYIVTVDEYAGAVCVDCLENNAPEFKQLEREGRAVVEVVPYYTIDEYTEEEGAPSCERCAGYAFNLG
jgi:hypothetical protein